MILQSYSKSQCNIYSYFQVEIIDTNGMFPHQNYIPRFQKDKSNWQQLLRDPVWRQPPAKHQQTE